MSSNSSIRLSSQLTSTYRLFLRATSAAVLHHPTATRNIRKLYRPIFDEAAEVEMQAKASQDPQTSNMFNHWLVEWNERVDNTLELLHNSATTQGLAHRLTRNIGFLTHAYLTSRKRKGKAWNPQLLPATSLHSTKPTIKPTKAPTAKEKKQQDRAAFDAAAFQSLGQVVRLAEAQSNVSLGRLPAISRTIFR